MYPRVATSITPTFQKGKETEAQVTGTESYSYLVAEPELMPAGFQVREPCRWPLLYRHCEETTASLHPGGPPTRGPLCVSWVGLM